MIREQREKISGSWKRIKKRSIKENIKRFLSLDEEASKIALSIALGLFIGLIIPMGFQTLVAIPFVVMFRCNLILTLVSTSISNPFTIIPIYYIAIKIGETVTSLSIPLSRLSVLVDKPSIDNLLLVGRDGIILIITGTFIIGFLLSITSYFIIKQFIINYRNHRTEIKTN